MARMPARRSLSDTTRQHDLVYQTLRARILTGGFPPGKAVTLRGLAGTLEAGFTPVREAVRRLIAERALEMGSTGRVSVPAMTRGKFDEIVFARCCLEPEMGRLALPHLTPAALAEIEATDKAMEQARSIGDAETYMRGNFEFHFTLYRMARAETLLGLAESIWLQLGPFMRVAYGRSGTADLKNQHLNICKALRARDAAALGELIKADIIYGMQITGELALDGGPGLAPKTPRRRKR
jgi:DNA-binding GntR family transcriptional regulator